MSRVIKLIWDFKGEDANQTAQHHVIHLSEFIEREKLDHNTTGTSIVNELHVIAYMHVAESDVFSVRDALMPHRAEIVAE